MTDFEEPFTPHSLDQQLDPFSSGVAHGQRVQLLSELHRFHSAAASAEQRSLASVWARIEARSAEHQADLSEKRPLPFPPSEARQDHLPHLRPREPKKRALATLVAVLAALVLIGGLTLALAQRGPSAASPTIRHSTPTPVPTQTQQADKAGKVVYTSKDTDSNSMVLVWSPDGKRILSAGSMVRIWDATTGQHVVTYHLLNATIPVQNAAWAPDNSQRVAIADGTSVRIINANTGKVLLPGPKGAAASLNTGHPNPLSQGTAAVRALAWSPDGNEIASSVTTMQPGLASRPIVIWNSHTGAVIKTLLGHVDDVYNLAWSLDGKYLASLAQGQDNTVRLWNPATGKQIYIVHPATPYGAMESLRWSPNSQYLAVQMQVQVGNNTLGTIVTKDEIQVWKAANHQLIARYPSPTSGIPFTGFSWAPDSKRIVTAIGFTEVGDNVFVWSALTGKKLYTHTSQLPEMGQLVAWSPDGAYIAETAWQVAQGSSGIIEIWTAPPGR